METSSDENFSDSSPEKMDKSDVKSNNNNNDFKLDFGKLGLKLGQAESNKGIEESVGYEDEGEEEKFQEVDTEQDQSFVFNKYGDTSRDGEEGKYMDLDSSSSDELYIEDPDLMYKTSPQSKKHNLPQLNFGNAIKGLGSKPSIAKFDDDKVLKPSQKSSASHLRSSKETSPVLGLGLDFNSIKRKSSSKSKKESVLKKSPSSKKKFSEILAFYNTKSNKSKQKKLKLTEKSSKIFKKLSSLSSPTNKDADSQAKQKKIIDLPKASRGPKIPTLNFGAPSMIKNSRKNLGVEDNNKVVPNLGLSPEIVEKLDQEKNVNTQNFSILNVSSMKNQLKGLSNSSQNLPLGGLNISNPNIEKSLDLNNPKLQLLLDNSSIKMSRHDAMHKKKHKRSLDDFLDSEMLYFSERKVRKLYDDEELHSLCLTLMISLLIKPTSGILEERYCSQHPISDGKPNYLHILHYHLNHSSNRYVIPLVMKHISKVKPYPSGQRLLKLLCSELNDVSVYDGWKKLGGGQYGVIYDCSIKLAPKKNVEVTSGAKICDKSAALKMMPFKDSIYDRSVLHDIFSEISCLEYFRLHKSVVTLYDFGVTDSDYFIVMKKFPMSLKKWRTDQKDNGKSLEEMLPVFK